jgi:hypothetical protein
VSVARVVRSGRAQMALFGAQHLDDVIDGGRGAVDQPGVVVAVRARPKGEAAASLHRERDESTTAPRAEHISLIDLNPRILNNFPISPKT